MNKTLIITALATASAMFGDVVVPNGPWQQVVTPLTFSGDGRTITSNTNNGPDGLPGTAGDNTSAAFWNNNSNDSTTQCANIGCYVTKQSFFAADPLSPALANPVYLGTNAGAAINDFNFTATGVQGGTQMLAEVAGQASSNWFGWYDSNVMTASGIAGFTSANRGSAWDVVYTGTNTTGDSVAFTPSTNFGLWFLPGFQNGAVATNAQILGAFATGGLFTQSSKDTFFDGANKQHFALFAQSAAAAGSVPATFWVGIEDVSFNNNADRDYNDMVIRLRVVPEPGYYVLLSLGLAGLGVARRRMNKAA